MPHFAWHFIKCMQFYCPSHTYPAIPYCTIFPFLTYFLQDFVEAGANIVTTNTYQCNLEEFGQDKNAFKNFINDAVEVAKSSGAEIVAGSIGPYGAKYKNGTSYTGIYNDIPIGIDEKDFLKKWHLPRIQCLIKNGVDILAFETCPKLIEGVAFSELIQELKYPGFICFQCRQSGPQNLKKSRQKKPVKSNKKIKKFAKLHF